MRAGDRAGAFSEMTVAPPPELKRATWGVYGSLSKKEICVSQRIFQAAPSNAT